MLAFYCLLLGILRQWDRGTFLIDPTGSMRNVPLSHCQETGKLTRARMRFGAISLRVSSPSSP